MFKTSEADALLRRSIEVSEAALRRRALQHMEDEHRSSPNGSGFLPPTWYRRSREANRRPVAYIKDWVTGKVRPRTMMDDAVDARCDERRAEWTEEQTSDEEDDDEMNDDENEDKKEEVKEYESEEMDVDW